MLEPHLVEIKHQEESKPQHPEPQAHKKLLHTPLYTEKNRRAPMPPDAHSKPARPSGDQISNTQYSHSYSWDKPA
jgi:hypothetical protein